MKNYSLLLEQLTTQEKVALVSGTEFWKTNPIPRLGIPSINLTDGPCGVRRQEDNADHLGLNESQPATAFPTGSCTASCWNPELFEQMGKAMAEEAKFYDVQVLLGPAVNIKRNPRCGRNFEYLSEDPLLSGKLGERFVASIEKAGVATSLKHFAVNNNENFRFNGDSRLDQRALREIYLKAFERIVKKAKPSTVMSAYNKVNGLYCSENGYLLNDILRKEWGYQGLVVSDWGGVNHRVKSLKAGMDLEMPGDVEFYRFQLLEAIRSGELSEIELNQSVLRVLELIDKTVSTEEVIEPDWKRHHDLAIELATEGAVLMKNDGILPLSKDKKYLLVGDFFEDMRFQGGGSSLVNPRQITSPKEAFEMRGLNYSFAKGYDQTGLADSEVLWSEVESKLADAEIILYFMGQTDFTESEGYDRDDISLPENQLELLDKLLLTGKKVVTILFGGSPVELSKVNQTNAILNMYLPGQGGGEAAARLLFGEKNPSGKLAETWVSSYDSVPFGKDYVTGKVENYRESIFVGYRYYDGVDRSKVAYSFGHGLSYTSFDYSDFKVDYLDEKIIASVKIKNSGKFAGAEVAQLYVSNPKSDVYKPVKEHRAFEKVFLEVDETKVVTFEFDLKDLAYYHTQLKDWVVENGKYLFHIATSSQKILDTKEIRIEEQPDIRSPYQRDILEGYYDLALIETISLETFETLLESSDCSELTQSEKYSLDSKLDEFKSHFLGKYFYRAVVGVGQKQYQNALKLPDGPERTTRLKNGVFISKMMPNNSIRSMSAASAGQFKYQMAQGILDLMNGHVIKAMFYFFKKYKVPNLPKNQK